MGGVGRSVEILPTRRAFELRHPFIRSNGLTDASKVKICPNFDKPIFVRPQISNRKPISEFLNSARRRKSRDFALMILYLGFFEPLF